MGDGKSAGGNERREQCHRQDCLRALSLGAKPIGINPIIQSLWFNLQGATDPPLSPNKFTDANVSTFLQGLADGGVLTDVETRGGSAVPWGNPKSFVCVIMPTNANFVTATTIGKHKTYSWTHARDVHGYTQSKMEFAWVTNNGTLSSITTIFSHEIPARPRELE
jgi:hypothetical protein